MTQAVQYFSDEYLKRCKAMTPDQILTFLEDYRKMRFDPGPLQQINLRIPGNVLGVFKEKAKREGTLYQHKIRELMTDWALQ